MIEINRARVPDEQYTFLIEQAQKCRNLARGVTDEDVVETLLAMAASYERRAGEMLERGTDN